MNGIPAVLGIRVPFVILMMGVSQALFAQTSESSVGPIVIKRFQPVRQLTAFENTLITHPTVCRDGTVVFARKGPDMSDMSDRWRLWSVPISGGEVRPITPVDFPEDATRPACSPDGNSLAFAAGPNRGQGFGEARENSDLRRAIWTLDLRSGRATPVTNKNGASDLYSAWFPDGRSLVVMRNTLSKAWVDDTDHWVVALDGKETPLVSWESYEGVGAVSPDGRHFLFTSTHGLEDPNGQKLWILDLDSGVESARLVWPSWDGKSFASDWSPDGRWFAFSCVPEERTAICIAKYAGTNPMMVQVTDGERVALHPKWSPDGKSIVFDSGKQSETTQIRVVDVSGVLEEFE